MSPLSSSAGPCGLNATQKQLIQYGLSSGVWSCWRWVGGRKVLHAILTTRSCHHRRRWEVGHEEGEKVIREDFHQEKVANYKGEQAYFFPPL